MQGFVSAIGVSGVFGPGYATFRQALANNDLGMRRLRGYVGQDFQPQLSCFVGPPGTDTALGRINALAQEAIQDLVQNLSGLDMSVEKTGIRVALVLPEASTEEGLPAGALDTLGEALGQQMIASLAVPLEGITIHTEGGAGLAVAIARHADGLEAGTSLVVLVVDSYCCRDRLNALLEQGRLFSDTTAYGMIPGEAAVAMLLRGQQTEQAFGCVEGAGFAVEPVGEFDDGDSDYVAMTDACLAAIPKGFQAAAVMTDWNNSRYRAGEMALSVVRLGPHFTGDAEIMHPALDFGDTGAAGQAIALLLALELGGNTLITGSGVLSHKRSALTLRSFLQPKAMDGADVDLS